MRGLYEIARLTMRESFKRRTATVAILFTAFLLIGMALLATHIEHGTEQRRESRGQPATVQVAGEPAEHAIFTELMRKGGLWIIRTFTMFLAILLAAGALAGERDSGALHTLTSKPLARWHLLVGKWLGMNAVLLLYLVVLGCVLTVILRLRTGEVNEQVFYGAVSSLMFGALFSTLTLAFSTCVSAWLAAALGLLSWLVGSQEYGIVRMIAHGLSQSEHTREAAQTLFGISRWCGLIVPSGRVALWIDKISGRLDLDDFARGAPFLRPEASPWDLGYLAIYVVALLVVSAWVFSRADL
jgi:ABC-type transport system involved in multi-copper enzyme maturation permease subunit